MNVNTPFEPEQLVNRAIRSGLITESEYQARREEFDRTAADVARSYAGSDEWGSSDWTYALEALLKRSGISCGFVDHRLTRLTP